ncbi:MAG: alpha/beta hydrolase [Ardenticatenaceae bacterium]|nr:alpha/beta hydrolase [Ardenticatenaceae bacterium]
MLTAAYILSFVCLLLNGLLLIRLNPPYNFYIFVFQILVGGLAPVLVLVGLSGAVLGWVSLAWIPVIAGCLGAAISVVYISLVTAPQPGFEDAFGENWENKIPPSLASHLLQRRWQLWLPQGQEPTLEQDISYWTIPSTDRELLCDIWQPAEGVERSGLAFIYLHGGAWYLGEKDFCTRPLFRRLADQGHVVMDANYRLGPEVDIYGMIGDVKRAVAWMKKNAGRYGVDLERIVLGGGSAGGHLALLAAYTPEESRLTPPELHGQDLTVRAVVSLYGPIDLQVCYDYLDQERMLTMPTVEIGQPGAATMEKNFADAGRLDMLLGGHLHEIPDVYALASPITHVSETSPPTLLIQGEPDCVNPAAAARDLHGKLVEYGVPAVNIIYPLTNHGFDLAFPQISPPAQSAFYYLERFLALMV